MVGSIKQENKKSFQTAGRTVNGRMEVYLWYCLMGCSLRHPMYIYTYIYILLPHVLQRFCFLEGGVIIIL